MLDDNVRKRGIAVRLGAPVERLIWLQDKGVRGVRVLLDGNSVDIIARRGVILACGGFESSEELKQSYLQAMPVLAGAVSGNTGDGILMAQAVGAKLRHMWHYHGPYGLAHTSKDYPFGIYLKAVPMWTPGVQDVSDLGVVDGAGKPLPTKALPKLPWIVCDANGQRFMDEYPPYPGDFGVRPLDQFDSKTQSFPRIPAYMIFDEVGRAMYPMGRCVSNDRNIWYAWSEDNEKEIALGIFERANTLTELAARAGIPAAALEQTVAAWNGACADGLDVAFGRRPETMLPIAAPPFYFGRVWPIVTNTQGGPTRNERAQVLDPFDVPIPRLYSAGELGSLFGHLYMSGGNLTECIVGGRIAGREAAGLPPWRS
jgi:succinate dehydrogenase/fumarate reductase flavoprotein subunit